MDYHSAEERYEQYEEEIEKLKAKIKLLEDVVADLSHDKWKYKNAFDVLFDKVGGKVV